ncbi:MAG: nucleotidyltransferase domain-containing protein [Actinomycetota bacterium]
MASGSRPPPTHARDGDGRPGKPVALETLPPETAFVISALRARYGGPEALTGAPGRAPDPGATLELMRRHAVEPLVVQAIEEAGVSVAEELEVPLRDVARRTRVANLEATGELIRVLDLLGEANIRALPYKGPVLAAAAYGDLGLRRFVDLDVLVEREHVMGALDLLERDGYRAVPSLSPRQLRATIENGHDRELIKDDRHVVEIQWAVADASNRLPRSVGPLIDRAATISIAGRQVPTLAPHDLVIVLAIHGSMHLWERLAWVCDLAETMRAAGPLDPAALERLASGAGGRRMLLLAVAMVDRILGAVPSPELLAAAEADPRTRMLADSLVPLVLGGDPRGAPASTRLRLSMALAERRADSVRKAWRSLVTPTASDWKTVPLPDVLWPLYYPVRLARLAGSYVIGDRRPGDVDVFD